MSIAFTTGGKLVPQTAIYREGFTSFNTVLTEVDVMEIEAVEIDQIQTVLTSDGLTVELQLLDGLSGSLADENFTVDLDFDCF